jgi:uncharacterized protein (DUF1800 family)
MTPNSQEVEPEDFLWNERTAEHLINRAGFGGQAAFVRRMAARSPADVVDWLLETRVERPPFDPELVLFLDAQKASELELGPDETRAMGEKLQGIDNTQYLNYCEAWYDSMVAGRQPLHDRMTLFWHGFFPTSTEVVRRKYEAIRQHQFLEENALGNYATLLRGITHDAAMLWFLDNEDNVKGHPNENLARELMELFSLGEGNYSEADVREASRALTGLSFDRDTGHSVFNREHHDGSEKTILGVKGELGSDDLVDILLAQDACARWVVGKIIGSLEGLAPEPLRLESYADFFRENDYEIKPLLRRLFLDPAFYRGEILGARVQSPVDYFVGAIRKLGIQNLPQWFIFQAVRNLGQGVYYPPSVEGWKDGEGWITNDSLMQRGNHAGVLLGLFAAGYSATERTSEPTGGQDMETSSLQTVLDAAMDSAVGTLRRNLRVSDKWRSQTTLPRRIKVQGVQTDEELLAFLLGELLAVEAPAETRRVLARHIARLRGDLGLEDASPLLEQDIDQDLLLRHLAHVILSLPEAQLG